jgi:phytol kinase
VLSFLTGLADFPLWWRIAVVPVYVSLIVVTAELCHRWCLLSPEPTRKIVHIGTGNVMAIAWLLQLPAWVGITSAVLAGITTLISYQLPILPGVNSVGRKSLGTFFYAVSIGLLTAIFWPMQRPEYGVLGILIMAWGDGLAAIVGQQWGQHPYQVWGNRKSIEGTIALAVVSYLLTVMILYIVQGNLPMTWAIGVPVAIAAVGLESISQLGIDNLTLPLGTALLAFWLNYLLSSGP